MLMQNAGLLVRAMLLLELGVMACDGRRSILISGMVCTAVSIPVQLRMLQRADSSCAVQDAVCRSAGGCHADPLVQRHCNDQHPAALLLLQPFIACLLCRSSPVCWWAPCCRTGSAP